MVSVMCSDFKLQLPKLELLKFWFKFSSSILMPYAKNSVYTANRVFVELIFI